MDVCRRSTCRPTAKECYERKEGKSSGWILEGDTTILADSQASPSTFFGVPRPCLREAVLFQFDYWFFRNDPRCQPESAGCFASLLSTGAIDLYDNSHADARKNAHTLGWLDATPRSGVHRPHTIPARSTIARIENCMQCTKPYSRRAAPPPCCDRCITQQRKR